jgi:hypothetical protein
VSFKDKLKDKLIWWLSARRSFFINDEYKIDLLYIDRSNNSAKIQVTNLKSNVVQDINVEAKDEQR